MGQVSSSMMLFISLVRNASMLSLWGLAVVLTPAGGVARWSGDMPASKREELRDEVLRAFRHAYGSYMAHACEFCRQVLSAERY